jgi:endonuclease YncB( thermonuclease family)
MPTAEDARLIRMTTKYWLGVLVVAAVSAAFPVWGAPSHAISGKVKAVHDGDTFTLEGGQRVRIFGIDAPELHQQCRADAVHAPGPSHCVPCGEAARTALEGLILGKEVHCGNRGRSYDRVVGECSVGKTQIGPWMLTHGQAVVYQQYLRKGDRAAYLGAEAGAKRANEGIWAMTMIPPAQWRKRARLECER